MYRCEPPSQNLGQRLFWSTFIMRTYNHNVCDCHAFIKGNLLTYLLTAVTEECLSVNIYEEMRLLGEQQ